jgi:octaprenyl-diphosphate synthase
LVGDYLLAKGLLLSVNNQEFKLLQIVSEAVKQMSEGELLQIEKVRRMDISESLYFDVIRQKTASLIASCCACGAASAGASDEVVEKMRLFGEKVGIAFQIKDDTFDFGTDNVGKPVGIDIKEKKVTLPLIYALNRADKAEKKRIINLVKNHKDDPLKIQEIINFVNEKEGVRYAHDKMLEYQEEAFAILQTFEPGEARTGLEQLVRYTTERKK